MKHLAALLLLLVAACFDEAPPNVCPDIDYLSVQPSSAQVGNTVLLKVNAEDPDLDVLHYTWHMPTAKFGSGASAQFQCFAVGAFSLRVEASDGLCSDERTFFVQCQDNTQ